MLYLFIVITFVIAEHKIKDYMEHHRELGVKKEILGGRIILRKYHNEGAFLNFLDNKKELVRTISGIFLGLLVLLFSLALPKKGNKLYKLGLSLLLGGAISNVSDRFRRGYVVDYFTINCKKLKTIIFNLADMAIFLGSALVLLSSVISSIFDGGSDKALE